MLLKALVITASIIATTLGSRGDTSVTDSLSTMLRLLGEESVEAS